MPRNTKTEPGQQLTRDAVKLIEDAIFSASTYVNMAIYAVLEATQELYFGSHSEKNLNVLEKVTIDTEVVENGNRRPLQIVKPYFSSTKQRGVERRAIAYADVKTKDGKQSPYYRYFNLSIDVTNTYKNGVPDPRDILTFLWGATWTRPTTAYMRGRVGYGGGVAVQTTFERKQRNRVEYNMYNIVEKVQREEGEEEGHTAQMVWTKEYTPPHTLIPIVRYGMLLGVENYEPHAMAYAFLKGLLIAGANTPRGIPIFEAYWLSEKEKEKVLVVDVGCWLLLEPVIVSPVIVSPSEVLEEFKRKTLKHQLFDNPDPEKVFEEARQGRTVRLAGNLAYEFLRKLAEEFAHNYLGKIDQLDIPRVKVLSQL